MFSPGNCSPESVSDVSDSEGTLDKNISSIISMLETPTSKAATPRKSDILKDVIAYVEVRSSFENRSKAITQQLLQLGASVVPKFSNDVTHVIFRDGKKSTRDKATKKHLHLVSVLWIEACKEQDHRVAETDYPAMVKDTAAVPLAIARLKKSKSMQPKDFEEELVTSAEKVERRRKMREKREKWKITETPVTPQMFIRNQYYVAETQPMSPVFLSPSVSIPETPPSMRRKMEQLRKKKALLENDPSSKDASILLDSFEDSPSSQIKSPLHKRLFESTSDSPTSSRGQATDLLSVNNLSGINSSFLEQNQTNPKPQRLFDSLTEDTTSGATAVVASMDTSEAQIAPENKVTKGRRKSVAASKCVKSKVLPRDDSSSNNSKLKGRKRKLMSLTDVPVDKLMSPANASNSVQSKGGILDIPKSKHSASHEQNTSTKRKRKASTRHSSDSDTIENEIKKQRRTMTKSGEPVELSVSGNISPSVKTNPKNKRRSMVSTPTQPTRASSRRKSCVPDINVRSTHSRMSGSPSERPCVLDIDTPNKTSEAAAVKSSKSSGSNKHRKRGVALGEMDQSTPNEKLPCSKVDTKYKKPAESCIEVNSKLSKVVRRRSTRRSSILGSVTLPDIAETHAESTTKVSSQRSQTSRTARSSHSIADNLDCITEDQSMTSVGGMSMAYSTLAPPDTSIQPLSRRKSCREFVLKKKAKTVSLSSAMDTSSSDDDKDLGKVGQRYRRKRQKSAQTQSGSGSDISCCSATVHGEVPAKRGGGPNKSIVLTSLHFSEQDSVHAVVQKLDGYFMEDVVSQNTTHVVCGSNRRTLNILLGISHGCWLVSLEWVFKSLEAGHWLKEDDFELTSFFPAAQKSRLARRTLTEDSRCGLFSEKGLIYVAERTAPPHHDLVHLLRLCGAQVTHCVRKAKLCVGNKQKSVVSVSEKWILDSITSHKDLPLEQYRL